MRVIDRAFIYQRRNFPKLMTLFLLIFILGTLMAGAITIRGAIEGMAERNRLRYPAVATLVWNHEAYLLEHSLTGSQLPGEGWQLPDLEMINAIGGLEGVRDFDIALETHLFDHGFKLPEIFINPEDFPEGVTWDDVTNSSRIMGGNSSDDALVMRGIHNPQLVDEAGGLITLTQGRYLTGWEIETGAPVVILSEALAAANGWDIGTRISLERIVRDRRLHSDPLLEDNILASKHLELEIVGLFQNQVQVSHHDPVIFFPEGGPGMWLRLMERTEIDQRLYTPLSIAVGLNLFVEETIWEHQAFPLGAHVDTPPSVDEIAWQSIFVMEDSHLTEEFIQQAATLLPDFWEVRDLSASYLSLVEAVSSTFWIATAISGGGIVMAIIISGLLIILSLKDRQKEIAIYLALGERRAKVFFQLIGETIAIFTLAVLTAFAAGNALARSLSQHIIRQELTAAIDLDPLAYTDGIPFYLTFFMPNRLSLEESLALFQVSLSGRELALFSGSFLLVLAAILLIAFVFVWFNKPKSELTG